LAGEGVEPDLDGEVRPPGRERVGGVEHRLDGFLRYDELGPPITGRLLAHRARVVDENRDGGAESFLDFGLIGRGRLHVAGLTAVGRSGTPVTGVAGKCQRHYKHERGDGRPRSSGHDDRSLSRLRYLFAAPGPRSAFPARSLVRRPLATATRPFTSTHSTPTE